MSASALIMMIISLGTIWGGLVWSILHLRRHPDSTSGDVD
ncbi:methionine/alanine import family NSS transporter small subunit [Brevibacterium yomogidense]|nr:methionine/alanine import family NSS transporter small subunit [Brevibacterium yomogidense]